MSATSQSNKPTIKRIEKRSVNGILLLDKPIGISSNAALQKVKYLLRARKAGHTGSLDPLASGMLPICLGEATKYAQYLLAADKRYIVSAKLGVQTETGDAEGAVVATKPVPELVLAELDSMLDRFRGEIKQIPSMYSALKHNGQPLYKLARQGITVEREPRDISIFNLGIISLQGDCLQLDVSCSKGTYIRSLVEDIGEMIGCGAHVIELRRLSVAGFASEQMITLADIEADPDGILAQHLLPVTTAVAHWPELTISSDMAFYLHRGESLMIPGAPTSGWVRLAHHDGQFLGVGEVLDGGKVAPRRLVRV